MFCTLNKHQLNSQTISGIKCIVVLGESQGKRQIHLNACKCNIKSAILTQKYLTIEAQIPEAEGPENVRMKMVAMKEPKDRHR